MPFRILILVSVIFLFSAHLCFGQPPDTLWTNTLGGAGSDLGKSFQQTSDGGYIITGMTDSFGSISSACYLVKTDAGGELEWEHSFDLDYYECAYSVRQTSDGGYILAGDSGDMPFGEAYIIKTDSAGVLEWESLFEAPYPNTHVTGQCVRQTFDGGYIIAGSTYSMGGGGIYLLKLDQLGEEEWSGTLGSGGPGDYWYGNAVEQTPDSGYIVAGSYGTTGYVVKTHPVSGIEWERTFGAGVSSFTAFNSVCITDSDDYLLAGTICPNEIGNYEVYLVMLDAAGDLLWEGTMGGPGGESASSAHQTADGGFIVAGSTNSYGSGNNDVYLLKVDESGSMEWQTWVGGPGNDGASAVLQTTDGDFVIAGSTNSFGNGYDVWIVKFGVPEGISERDPNIPGCISCTAFPNPCTGSSQIRYTIPSTSRTEITLFDISGRLVKTLIDQVHLTGEYTVTWNGNFEDGEEVPGGVYFIHMNACNLQALERVILIR